MELSIVIVAYQAQEYLNRLIKSIPKRKDWEIIVIDNNQTNRGFAKACNLGASQAKGKWLLFVNPDCEVSHGAIETLLKKIKSDKRIGIIGPQLVDDKEQPYLSTTKQPTPLTAPFIYTGLGGNEYWYKSFGLEIEREVESISGAAMMMSKQDFEKVGGFDERYFMYWEDYDLCRKVLDLNKKIWYYPEAKVRHSLGKSTVKVGQAEKWFREARFQYFKKYWGWVYASGLELWLLGFREWRLIGIVAVATWLRFDQLNHLMPIIPDQGFDYLNAWEVVKTGKLPLLGIASSLPQFHQGPLFVWLLALTFWIFGPSALAAGYLAATIGLVSVVMTYIFANNWWNRKVATIAALIMATSPLAVAQARMAFMINPIPLFTLLYLGALQRKYKKPRDYFWVILAFGLLFQFELAHFPLIILALVYGWRVRKIANWRLWTWGGLGLGVGLIPQFQQIGLFMGWVGYRVVRFTGLFPGRRSEYDKLPKVLNLFNDYLTKFVSGDKPWILSIAILILMVGVGIFIRQKHKDFIGYIWLWIGVMIVGYYIHGAPSEAYFPVLFVPISLAVAWTISRYRWLSVGVVLLAVSNSWLLLTRDYLVENYSAPLEVQERVVRKWLQAAKGQPLAIKAFGTGSEFASATDNYKFLVIGQGGTLSDQGYPIGVLMGEAVNKIPLVNVRVYEEEGVTYALPNL